MIRAIEENPQESSKEWLLWMMEKVGKANSNNSNITINLTYNFGK